MMNFKSVQDKNNFSIFFQKNFPVQKYFHFLSLFYTQLALSLFAENLCMNKCIN